LNFVETNSEDSTVILLGGVGKDARGKEAQEMRDDELENATESAREKLLRIDDGAKETARGPDEG